MTRCFLAFEFAPESLAYLEEQIEPVHRWLRDDHGWPLRLVIAKNWHVTLLFFDGLDEPERRQLWRHVAEQVEQGVSDGPWRAPEFAWQGLSLWPTARRPSLVCLVAEPAPAAGAWPLPVATAPCAKGNVGHYLAYRPHATVMRFKGRGGSAPWGRQWKGLRDELPAFDSARIRCDRISMFLSILSGEQPVYPREFTLALTQS